MGGGHASGALGPLHFGLPAEGDIEVRVTWPDGNLGDWQGASADWWSTIDRDAGTVVPANLQGG